MSFNLAWRLFRHEARRGELTIILVAIVLSVASVLSLSLFSERLQTALTARTAEFIAADRVLDASKPVPEAWLTEAQGRGLQQAHQVYTQSMAFANEEMLLVDLRAANDAYPLKGKVKTAQKPFQPGTETDDIPSAGETWIESQLFKQLNLQLGQKLEIGDLEFTITRVLAEVPDSGFNVFATNPKVLINIADLPATQVIGPGSRATYAYFFAGESADLDGYYDWLESQLDSEIHDWNSVEDDESPLGRSVARAEQYFLLASLLAIVLASVAIAVAAQRYSQRHYDPVAIMKTLGASKQFVQRVYLLQILLITGLGIVLGAVIGFVVQQLVVNAIAEQIPVSLETWHWGSLWIAVFTGLVCALLFSMYPLMRLFSVPPLRVLRKDVGAALSSKAIQFLAAGSAILLLMWAYSRDLKLSLIIFVSGIVLVAILLAATMVLIRVGRRLGQGRTGAWQLAWARIQRRAMDNSVQLISFSVTIMLLLVVLVMRNDMLQQWRDQLPEGTPNYFMINVADQDVGALQSHFAGHDVQVDDMHPMVVGRFVAVNGEQVRTDVSKEEEQDSGGRASLGREANVTWNLKLQNENEVVAGQWLDQWQPGEPLGVSVEERAAERLDIKLGDVLSFNFGSEVVEVTVTSLRSVNWQTMQPNFFFVLHPEAMKAFVPTYMTSFHLPASRKSVIPQLMAPYPTVSLFDVDARINQLREIIEQVSLAVEFILVLVLVAGSLVLVAQVQASMDERQQELAILRTLGAKGSLIRGSVILEFIIIGSVAGLMAAVANEFTLYLLQSQVFQMQASIHWQYWGIAPLVGAGIVGVLGAISCRRLLALNTSQLLRQMV